MVAMDVLRELVLVAYQVSRRLIKADVREVVKTSCSPHKHHQRKEEREGREAAREQQRIGKENIDDRQEGIEERDHESARQRYSHQALKVARLNVTRLRYILWMT